MSETIENPSTSEDVEGYAMDKVIHSNTTKTIDGESSTIDHIDGLDNNTNEAKESFIKDTNNG